MYGTRDERQPNERNLSGEQKWMMYTNEDDKKWTDKVNQQRIGNEWEHLKCKGMPIMRETKQANE